MQFKSKTSYLSNISYIRLWRKTFPWSCGIYSNAISVKIWPFNHMSFFLSYLKNASCPWYKCYFQKYLRNWKQRGLILLFQLELREKTGRDWEICLPIIINFVTHVLWLTQVSQRQSLDLTKIVPDSQLEVAFQ